MAGNVTSKFSARAGDPERTGAPQAPLLLMLMDRNTAAIGALLVESAKQPDTGIRQPN
jgi:hypothetical protein